MTVPDISAPPTHTGILSAVRRRPRLFICALIAIAVYFVTPSYIREATRALIAWNIGSASFIVMVIVMMVRSARGSIRAHGAEEDENPWGLLIIAAVAGVAALAAIVWELGPVKELTGWAKGGHLALVGATILTSWTFIHLTFALHYAGEYYGEAQGSDGAPSIRRGLAFPNEDEPGWDEFVYQAFVIGCACATADVNATSSSMRGICLAQGILAFFFNTIILALTINIGAGLF